MEGPVGEKDDTKWGILRNVQFFLYKWNPAYSVVRRTGNDINGPTDRHK